MVGLRLSAITNFDAVSEVSSAMQGALLVMPAAPVYPWFCNFTDIVNDYLEAPPFNFTNAFKDRGVLKKVTLMICSSSNFLLFTYFNKNVSLK